MTLPLQYIVYLLAFCLLGMFNGVTMTPYTLLYIGVGWYLFKIDDIDGNRNDRVTDT